MRGGAPIGAYVSGSPLASVDARAKAAVLLAWTVAVFAAPGWPVLAAAFALLACAMRTARVGVASVVRAIRPAAVVLALVLVANAVSLDGSAGLRLAGPVGVDVAGALRGASMCLRIVVLAGLALTLSASTTPPELADAFTWALRPLRRLGVPADDVGMALSIALRFIPLVSEELDRIVLAQRARGVRFDRGGVLERVPRWASVVTPLAVGLFRRADALAESMAARAYGTCERTRMQGRLHARDGVVLAASLALMVIAWCTALAV